MKLYYKLKRRQKLLSVLPPLFLCKFNYLENSLLLLKKLEPYSYILSELPTENHLLILLFFTYTLTFLSFRTVTNNIWSAIIERRTALFAATTNSNANSDKSSCLSSQKSFVNFSHIIEAIQYSPFIFSSLAFTIFPHISLSHSIKTGV